ncbi:cellulose binding domain-containing protein [Actinoplanes couchii]|uniref:CBM2 domain-containing protein n=1 Tax=Actinoplanes couchii TaxID=403638 RepID=A0ABQ3WZK5_9ACTN|nr:cellulose binding domain-containing protein [Actinoplanes couchii]MDR6316096.1 hypothetical protein [Actinoplanes couchii]GID51709.1 hypothetical protein Aco03nite_001130 [Actinoplanes couchii]
MTKRRTPADVVRDAAWRLATAMLTSPTPEPRLIKPGGAHARRPIAGRLMLVSGALAAVAVTALLVIFLVDRPFQGKVTPDEAAGLPGRTVEANTPPGSGTPAQSGTSPSADSTGPSASASVSVAPSVSQGAPSLSPTSPGGGGSLPPTGGDGASPAPLTAGLSTTPYLLGLLGYRTNVTVANPGTAARTGWTLAITLPRSSLKVADVKGATASQQGTVWTFTPDASTTEIDGGDQAAITFNVNGDTLLNAAPTSCTIDGTPCS